MTKITAAGTSIPIPTAVGEGTQVTCRLSSTAYDTPKRKAMTSAATAPWDNALKPCERISPNPAHFREMGDESPACSPTMPYVSRRSGYIHDTAAAPTGVAISCIMVRYFGEEPIM